MSSKFKIFTAGVIILVIGGAMFWVIEKRSPPKVKITTRKSEYNLEESLKLDIKNNLEKSVCFSSCYPYRLQKKNTKWEDYQYSPCPKEDIVQSCIEPQKSKTFELTLQGETGLHRILVPLCLDCQKGQTFIKEKTSYSNEFNVK